MVKVLIISGTGLISGAEYVLADYLNTTAHRGEIMLLHSDLKEVNAFYRGLGIKETAFGSLNPSGAGKRGGFVSVLIKLMNYFRSFFGLTAAMHSSGAGLVAGNNTGDVIYSLHAFLTGRKFVAHIHDMMRRGSVLSAAVRIFDPFIFKYIAVSNAVKNSLAGMGIDPGKIDTIYNGLCPDKRPAGTKKSGFLHFGFVGNIEERKAPLEFVGFLESAVRGGLRAKGKMISGNIVDRALYGALRQKIRVSGCDVEFAGRIGRQKMERFYRSLDFLVVTSKTDPLPTVVMEAFNCHVPVIGRRADGIPEMIKDGRNGYLFATDREFGRIVGRIKNLSARGYRRMQNNARETLEKKFNLREKTGKIDAVFFGLRAEARTGGTLGR